MSVETVHCGDALRVDNIGAFYGRLLLLLANDKQVALDCSQLESIDTPALQMLAAFSKEADIHGQTVIWLQPGQILLNNLRLLGLEQIVPVAEIENV